MIMSPPTPPNHQSSRPWTVVADAQLIALLACTFYQEPVVVMVMMSLLSRRNQLPRSHRFLHSLPPFTVYCFCRAWTFVALHRSVRRPIYLLALTHYHLYYHLWATPVCVCFSGVATTVSSRWQTIFLSHYHHSLAHNLYVGCLFCKPSPPRVSPLSNVFQFEVKTVLLTPLKAQSSHRPRTMCALSPSLSTARRYNSFLFSLFNAYTSSFPSFLYSSLFAFYRCFLACRN